MSTKTKTIETTQHTAEAALEATTAQVSAGFEKTLSSMKEGMENATKGFETQQVKIKETMVKAMKTSEDLVAFSQGNFEAFVKAGQIFTSGIHGISKHIASSTQASVEETVALTKALAGVKSVKEAVDLQTGYARSVVEKAVAETGKVTDASLKLTEQTIAPLTARVTLAVEKFGAAI